MSTTDAAVARRTGRAAITAGIMLFLGVGPELVWQVQRPDGTVTNLAGFVLYASCWLIGAVALFVTVFGLGGRRSPFGPLPRSGRIGRGACLVGAALLVAFGPVGIVTVVVAGAPAEWSFLLFALGMLLFLPGGVALALGLRRAGGAGGGWIAVLVAAAGVLVALGASADPWHDLGLFVFDAAWVALGARLLAGQPSPATRPAATATSLR